MGDNKEERKKMKKTRYVALVLLSSLLTLVGCSRREILDDYPVTGINIRLDWEGVTGRLPEGIRVIFYPKDAQGRKIDTYLPAKGGEMKVPPGHYLAVIYNYDTQSPVPTAKIIISENRRAEPKEALLSSWGASRRCSKSFSPKPFPKAHRAHRKSGRTAPWEAVRHTA